jgi:hypothetical protein
VHDAPHLDFLFNYGIAPSGTAYNKSAVFATSYFAENDLIADHSFNLLWAAQGRKTVNSRQEFATRDQGENTTSWRLQLGQWNVITNRCLSKYLDDRSIRGQVVLEAANRTPAEVKYSILGLAVCGHPLAILSLCWRNRLFHWYSFKAFVKAIMIRILGIRWFTRLVKGKRGLVPVD